MRMLDAGVLQGWWRRLVRGKIAVTTVGLGRCRSDGVLYVGRGGRNVEVLLLHGDKVGGGLWYDFGPGRLGGAMVWVVSGVTRGCRYVQVVLR